MLGCFGFGPSSTSIEEVTTTTTTSIGGGANWKLLPATNLKVYTFMELKKATGNFRRDGMLSQDGYGTLFKGWVDVKTLAPSRWGSGMAVAVVRPRSGDMQSYFTETKSQVDFLQRLAHPNVIKLVGYCLKGKEQLIVHEFMINGTLDTRLFRRGDSSIEPISWDNRIKIASGAARGLNFLHCAEEQIIYRDFKLKNILLDGNYNAKISDFSCALLGPPGEEMCVDADVIGTYGYVDPEYATTGQVRVKSDVYSFGVVLLELLTGLRVNDDYGPEARKQNLTEWAKPLLPHRRNLKTIIDVRMEGQYSSDAAFKAAQLTLKCLGLEPQTRPSMKEVVEALEKIDKMKPQKRDGRLNSIRIQQSKSG